MDKIKYTELECIHYCIGRGFKGAEKRLETFVKAGKLNSTKSIQSLIKDMGIDYIDVQLELGDNGKPLRGLDRRYIMSGKRNAPKQRVYEYKGRQPTKEDRIMDSYIFNCLVHLAKESTQTTPSYSYTKWIKELSMFNTNELNGVEAKDILNHIHKEDIRDDTLNQILFKFKSAINSRNRSIIKSGLKRLEEEKRIELIITYMFKTLGNRFIEVEKHVYEMVDNEVSEELERLGVDKGSYSIMKDKKIKSEFEENICNTIKDILESYDIDFYYKTHAAKMLDYNCVDSIDKNDFNNAYDKRLKFLTKKNQRSYTKNDKLETWQQHYLLNTFSLLKLLGFQGLDNEIDKAKESIPDGFWSQMDDLF